MLYALSMYLARLTLGSIGVTNQGATTIMAWLNKIASIIAHTNSPVCWITPLGLPVVQPYRRENVYHDARCAGQGQQVDDVRGNDA